MKRDKNRFGLVKDLAFAVALAVATGLGVKTGSELYQASRQKTIKYIPYKRYRKVQPVGRKFESSNLDTFAEFITDEPTNLESFVREHSENFNSIAPGELRDPDDFYQKIMQTSGILGYKDLDKLTIQEFIRWNVNIVKYWGKPDPNFMNLPGAPDIPHPVDKEYLDDLLNVSSAKKDNLNIICRHYSAFLLQVFNQTKHLNPNLKNTYCIMVGNKTHGWNLYLTETEDRIYVTSADATFSDHGLLNLNAQIDFSSPKHKAKVWNKDWIKKQL